MLRFQGVLSVAIFLFSVSDALPEVEEVLNVPTGYKCSVKV
jgi:hypothetical protein